MKYKLQSTHISDMPALHLHAGRRSPRRQEDAGGTVVEDVMHRGLDKIVLEACVMEVAQSMGEQYAGDGQLLYDRVSNVLVGNTTAERQKTRAWSLYLMLTMGHIPKPGSVVPWPPTEQQWVGFLEALRPRIRSHSAWKQVGEQVCLVGAELHARRVGGDLHDYDPRRLYVRAHARTVKALLRQYGVGITQVRGVDMTEARNGSKFVDATTMEGIMMAASFTTGVVLGGRRPRTLTAMRLRDIDVKVDWATVGGQRVLVPGVTVRYVDEKVEDLQGPRRSSECHLGSDSYAADMLEGPAFWIYYMLCLRGAFHTPDPIKTMQYSADKPASNTIPIRKDATDWFLFCECKGDLWHDTEPTSVGKLGRWTRNILKGMGKPGRGFSAHRRGCVTRACILALFDTKGRELPEDVLHAIVRWGGWTGVTGIMTMIRIYACHAMDEYLDGFALGLGKTKSDAAWAARKAEYIGPELTPVGGVARHKTKAGLPMVVKTHAYADPGFIAARNSMVVAARAVLAAALRDKRTMPWARWQEARAAFVQYCKLERCSTVVTEYYAAKARLLRSWQQARQYAVRECEVAFQAHLALRGHGARVKQGFSLHHVHEHHVGYVCPWPWAAAHNGACDVTGLPQYQFP